MIDDWADKRPPDIFRFFPFTYKVRLRAHEFEICCVTNQWNWIDCDEPHTANAQMALCGELFEARFDLPYVDFLPETLDLTYLIEVRSEKIICEV